VSRRSSCTRVVALIALGLLLPGLSAAQMSAYYGIFGKNKVQYRNLKWKVYHSPHFDVYYYTEQEELLQKIVSFAESAYDQLSQEFDFQIQKPTSLIFYETHSAFEQNNEIPNFIPEGIGAFATDVRKRMFMPVDLPDPELWSLILHELTHIFQYHILFGGSLGRGIASGAPLWLMEGMASFMEGEESARDKMFVRDAVVNDMIPPIAQGGATGFFAYRFGYAVFEFMVDRWGEEGFRDFLIEFRNTLGGRVGRAIERAFQMSPDEFDAEFRRWLRKRYLAELLETGEPSDFGHRFRTKHHANSAEISPVASPSGDLVAAFATYKGDVDVVLFDTQTRDVYKNLTKGLSEKYQYYVAQELTLGRKQGRDIAFSPDGNYVAFFARKNRGRHLVLVNVIKGKIRRSIPMDIEQQLSPTWSPDGKRVAFSGWVEGRFDIFEIDLETEEVTNLTNDEIFDAAPVYSPDGESMLITSVVGGYSKIFRIQLDNPSQRIPVREGLRSQTNETDPTFSPDGKRIYFTSDATGINNIFSFNTENGVVTQHTDVVTGCFQPTVLAGPSGHDRLVYAGYWKGRFDLFYQDLDDPITAPEQVSEEQIAQAQSLRAEDLPRFEPSIEVTIDDANKDKYGGKKFYLQDIMGGTIGVSDDQTFIAQIGFVFSDFLGDRKIIGVFESISSFQNFDVIYLNQKRRLQWSAHIFDRRDFFVIADNLTGNVQRIDSVIAFTGVRGSLIYPLSVNHRIVGGIGYFKRDINFNVLSVDPEGNPVIGPREDDYPEISADIIGDTTVFLPWGPVNGRRYRFWGSYAPDLDNTGPDSALTAGVGMDFRQYFMVTRRINLAFRLWGASMDGNFPTPLYIGGLDTLRGFEYRSISGNNAFFSNVEARFPLIDLLAIPGFAIGNIRGNIFLDVGGAYYDLGDNDFNCAFYSSEELEVAEERENCFSSYGWGVSFRIFGLDLNWDFAKRWNFSETFSDGFETSFWIGRRF